MIVKSSVQELFPTPLWVADLPPEQALSLNSKLKTLIYGQADRPPNLQVGATWQTDPNLQQRAEFAEFIGLVNLAARSALEFLQVRYDGFEVTGCWANINPQTGMNPAHMHPNNFLSGVYYVSLPGDTGEIVFSDPRPQAAMVMPVVKQWNRYTSNESRVVLKPGRFVLFPAWLVHWVPVNPSPEHRISIAYNIMFSDFTRQVSPPQWQGNAPLLPPASV
ncbi:TIGR02466 family protein [Ferrovibrio xuzhouensis]|uniref:TIGR02466 family protein n=1 Tax=Ferrovibrio xuzhouensis TaxID=1576914 RepID=A0ABV7VJT1_9PROT